MNLKISSKGGRTLQIEKAELKCAYCGDKESKDWFYCNELDKVICGFCARRHGCFHKKDLIFKCGTTTHTDFYIDKIEYIEGKAK